MKVEEVLTASEAATLMQMNPDTVRKLTKRGAIPGQIIGRQYRYSRSALIDWLSSSKRFALKAPTRLKETVLPKVRDRFAGKI